MTFAALSVGSNLGDREGYIAAMERELGASLTDTRSSPLMETAPVGVPDVQPPYLNKIVTGMFSGTPRELLGVCFAIEKKLGRTRTAPKGARTADVDILLFGDMTISEDGLVIPHPEILNRRFCIEGLAAIDPSIVMPGGQTIGDVYKKMPANIACQNVSFI